MALPPQPNRRTARREWIEHALSELNERQLRMNAEYQVWRREVMERAAAEAEWRCHPMRTLWQRVVEWLTPCRATVFYLVAEGGAGAGEAPAAGGQGVGPGEAAPRWVIACEHGQPRCKRCPRFHALRQLAAAQVARQKGEALAVAAQGEAQFRDRDRERAEIHDRYAKAISPAIVIKGDGDHAQADAVAVKGVPGVQEAQRGAEQAKRQPGDGRDEREGLHGRRISKPAAGASEKES